MTIVYNPKTFFLYAASLRQSFLHCAIFPTAASRRSLGRISVPMWPFNLSVRLLIVALVGRYPTNKLIRRKPIYQRITPFLAVPCDTTSLCGISNDFSLLFPSDRQVAYVLLTSPPLKPLSKVYVNFKSDKSSNQYQFHNDDFRSTCMSYVRRQRLSWARIKLSDLLYLYFKNINLNWFF